MKKNYFIASCIIFCLALCSLNIFAQAPAWQWAKNGAGIYVDEAFSVGVDASGNSYITGFFQSPTIAFNSATLTNTSTAGNPADVFIVKYDPSGNLIWADSAGGTNDDVANDIAVDAVGNSFITGYFLSSTITFGSVTLTNTGGSDLFLVKYDAAGNVLWAKNAGGNASDLANSVSIDAAGNSYVTGNFQSPAITFGSTTLTNGATNGTADIFLVKYDPLGNVLWATSVGGSDEDVSKSIATDGSGNSYITGNFLNSMTIGSTTMTSNGFDDVFVAKFDVSGNALWATSAGGNNRDMSNTVAIDAAGNCFIAGRFVSSSLVFGSTTLINSGSYDLFIAKYNSSGTALWAQSAGGSAAVNATGIAVDPSGNSFVTGSFADTTITINSVTLHNHDITGFTADMFLTKLDPAGNVIWAKCEDANGATSVCVDGVGNGYVAGYYWELMVSFGPTVFINASNNGKIGDVFLAKIGKDIDGINSFENSNNAISIFPNPSSGIFHLEINGGNFSETTIEIYDVLGNIVFTSEILNAQAEINLSEKAKGIYFYRVMNAAGIIGTGKMVVR